ncbi:MAG: hypothetical protein CBB87_03940 [Micavibrio sp. TMED27]|nr:hypothetical protein [Micavibrio sp.]OUT91972.1 MAG: hypothetical protein CBB87_03940 [Micavibrio sp. TMED27]|tara:strand:+ start:610 stop:825 length:216 start_codon:yes stop_codon:yes gene_type:complete
MHQALLGTLIMIVLGAAGLTIVQIWAPIMSWDIYFKFLVTGGIVALAIGFLIIIKADFGQHKKLKDENYLD